MRFRIIAAGILLFMATQIQAAPDLNSGSRYLEVYLKINDAEHLEAKGDLAGALKDFQECHGKLLAIQTDNPNWETALVGHRIQDCRAKILDLEGKLKMQPDIGTPTQEATIHYPWKSGVVADVFFIGKDGKVSSAWDKDWVKTNGGIDSPSNRNGFATAGHASKINPFYVALPFNDLAHPELAVDWVPRGWPRASSKGQPISACKDRWVWIKTADGRSCYAQWEDAGPGADDDAEYVFGSGLPKDKDKPALSVSPGVADYLGLSRDNKNPSLVSWRFVDNADVRPGAWLKYDEQAVIYAGMNR